MKKTVVTAAGGLAWRCNWCSQSFRVNV